MTRPEKFSLPSCEALKTELPNFIKAVRDEGKFNGNADGVTKVTYEKKAKGKGGAGKEADAGEDAAGDAA